MAPCVLCLLADSRSQPATEWLLTGRSVSAKSAPSLSLPTAQHPYRLSTVSTLRLASPARRSIIHTPEAIAKPISFSQDLVVSDFLSSLSSNRVAMHPLCDSFIHSSTLCSDCCGCGKEFKNEQSLVALDKHWHLGCFKCKVCNKVLNAEYISK